MSYNHDKELVARRHILRGIGGTAVIAGGLSLLSACGDDDETPTTGSTATPTPTPSLTPPGPVAPGPTYTATDADRLNFALQINYLLAAYFLRGVLGADLPPVLTTGSGTAGSVAGGAQVSFAEGALADNLREIAINVQTQIAFLRRVLGNAATARPAISIAGGASSPFQAIASTTAFPAATPFNPYVSETNYLIGAVALSGAMSGVLIDLARQITDATLRDGVGGMLAAATQHDVMVRLELFSRGQTDTTLYARLNQMSDARDALANLDVDQGVGNQNSFNIAQADGQGGALRRTPEVVLNLFYATRSPVTSGAFFPAGVNGTIRSSGSRAG